MFSELIIKQALSMLSKLGEDELSALFGKLSPSQKALVRRLVKRLVVIVK